MKISRLNALVITAGRTFVKEVKRQFGGVTPRFHPKVARGTDNQPCHAPEEPEGDSTCEVTQTMEPPIALIAVNDDIDEFNTVSGASEEQHVQPSRRVVMRGTPTTETAAAGRLDALYSREELTKRYHIRKSTGQVPVQNRPWSAQSTNSVATTPEIPPHCMQFTESASNTLARTSQSKRAHHEQIRSSPYAVSATWFRWRTWSTTTTWIQRRKWLWSTWRMRDSLIYPPAGRRGSQWNTQTDRSRSAQRSGNQVAGQEEEVKQAVAVLTRFLDRRRSTSSLNHRWSIRHGPNSKRYQKGRSTDCQLNSTALLHVYRAVVCRPMVILKVLLVPKTRVFPLRSIFA